LRNAGLARNATSLKDEAIKNSSAVQNYKGPFAGKRKLQGEVIAEWEKSYGNGPRRTLENDNLARHEKPVLVEMGLPYRDDYFNG
jgi:hypothetical protein